MNRYRWVRGFNEYDNWQASGVSGQGARSFYYPANSMMCADCHMPQVPSNDEGNINGFVHSHRFPGANTAVPTANQDADQLAQSVKFLQDKQLTVDIFADFAGRERIAASPSSPAGGAGTLDDVCRRRGGGYVRRRKARPAKCDRSLRPWAGGCGRAPRR